jgi:anhydro-N-acetylmuramic acid kinase
MTSYQVIGVMSGTSLDGVDLACGVFTRQEDIWIYKILNTLTIPYPERWQQLLPALMETSAAELVQAHSTYGHYLGDLVKHFVEMNGLQPDFIASHGHTIFHQPDRQCCFQLGSGAHIAAASGLPVVSDFRSLDIALGGQGAPLVPVGDQLLFADYDCCLNLGGIANLSYQSAAKRLAYDVCVCNLALNHLAQLEGKPYDNGGKLARAGKINEQLLRQLLSPEYYHQLPPKSLGREWVEENVIALLDASSISVADKLHTVCHLIAQQLALAFKQHLQTNLAYKSKVLVTGGGAYNTFLLELTNLYCKGEVELVVPENEVVEFKEALIFAFLGVLRWEKLPNSLAAVTGAPHDNVGGCIYWT